jgi:hypothetical protein
MNIYYILSTSYTDSSLHRCGQGNLGIAWRSAGGKSNAGNRIYLNLFSHIIFPQNSPPASK